MPQVTRTDQAELDLIDILVYLSRFGQGAADRFSAALDRACQLRAQFPQMGDACEELGPGVRRFPVGSYLVYYRPVDGGIEILRVIHSSRNVTSLLLP